MKFPHTPAPWSLGSNGASTKVVDAEGKAVCMVTYRKDHWNGDLLAAAPDLLNALLRIQARADYGKDNPRKQTDVLFDILELSRDVIAKATGENT